MLAVLGLFAVSASTDVYFEQTTVVLQNGRPSGPGVVSRVWHAGRKMRMEAGGRTDGAALVLRLDQGKAFRVEPERHAVVRLDLDELRARAEMDASMAGDLMGAGEETRVRAARGGAARVVAGHPCEPWRLSGGPTVMVVCLARDVPVGIAAFADLLEWTGAEQALPGFLAELRRLRGFPMETHSRVTVVGEVRETLSTVTRVTPGPIDPALFEPPPSYNIESAPESPPAP
jgi:hypothetical protein